jgi:metal-sulfur cluster biosynthetic enzyme
MTSTAPVSAAVWAALDDVYDPCGQAWRRPMSVRDLGLVRDATVDRHGHATVRVSLTTPFCTGLATIMRAVEARVGGVEGVTGVTVHIDAETPWQPALMTDAGRATLAAHRAADRARRQPPGGARQRYDGLNGTTD